MTPRILAFSGSTRTESFNKKLVRVMAGLAKDAGADVTVKGGAEGTLFVRRGGRLYQEISFAR